jgi:hypothetical protein
LAKVLAKPRNLDVRESIVVLDYWPELPNRIRSVDPDACPQPRRTRRIHVAAYHSLARTGVEVDVTHQLTVLVELVPPYGLSAGVEVFHARATPVMRDDDHRLAVAVVAGGPLTIRKWIWSLGKVGRDSSIRVGDATMRRWGRIDPETQNGNVSERGDWGGQVEVQ